MSKDICKKCLSELRQFYILRQQIEESDGILRRLKDELSLTIGTDKSKQIACNLDFNQYIYVCLLESFV